MNTMPYYMTGYEEIWKEDPRKAKIAWLRNAKYGLFLHYGLFSIHDTFQSSGTQEWCQQRQKIPVAEYEKLRDRFTAEHFDAKYIASFAKQCGMSYINMVTRHHDSFCLWDTAYTDFNSMNSLARRDLVQEMYDACREKGLGLMLYYSHGRDWRHPHAPNNDEWGGAARPEYNPPEPSYAYGKDHDLQKYLDFMENQITELIRKFPDCIGIWLDGQAVPVSGDVSRFRIQELYDRIHSLSPHVLVSYKQGVLGTEDFFTPEHAMPKVGEKGREDYQKNASRMGRMGELGDRLVEINTTMIHDPVSWGYTPLGTHFTAREVYEKIENARSLGANFVMNTGVCPDGSIDPVDDRVLRKTGEMLRSSGLLQR